MNLTLVSRAYHASQLALKAKGPTLMVVGGVISMGAAVVTASKKTLAIEEVLEEYVPQLEKIQTGTELNLSGYTAEVARKDRVIVYSRAGASLAKHYAVPGVLFIGGACLVFGGHRMMLQRNATLAIAFTGVQRAFQAYRANVVDAFGHEADQGMLTGWKKMEVHDDVSGKSEIVNTRDWDGASSDPYNRVFEQGVSSEWEPDLGINKSFIENQRDFAQKRLGHNGVLYLSEVYKALGFAETPISRVVGWKITRLPDGSKNIPVVDFGLNKPLPDDWKYTRDHAIYLDFNCQGLVVGGMIQKILEQA